MSRKSWLALVVTLGTISGCASRNQIVDVPLNATPQNAEHIARANLSPVGNQTSIWVTVVVSLTTWLYLAASLLLSTLARVSS